MLEPDGELATPVVLSEHSIRIVVNLFPSRLAMGPDGLRTGHLQALLGKESADAGAHLLSSLTLFINMVLQGEVSKAVRPVFVSANLFALTKKDGGFCPIAVGNTLRRLPTKAGV